MESPEKDIINNLQSDICAMVLDPGRTSLLDRLVKYLRERYHATRTMFYLEKALELAHEALETTSRENDNWYGRLITLGSLRADKYFHTRTIADLEEAICVTHEAVDVTTPEDPGHDVSLSNLGELFNSVFFETGHVATLEKAISSMRRAIEITPQNHPLWAKRLSSLGDKLKIKYEYSEDIADLDEAIHLSQEAVNATPVNHSDRVAYLDRLARHLSYRHSATQAITDLDDTISISQQASSTALLNHPLRARCLVHHGHRLMKRYWSTGSLADLEEAVYVMFESVDACKMDDEDWSGVLNDLGMCVAHRFISSKAMADATAAIVIAQEAINVAAQNDTNLMGALLQNLSVYIKQRYSLNGSLADLNEAIRMSQLALDVLPDQAESIVDALNNHASYLGERYQHTKAMSDIEEAIRIAREAVSLMSPNYSERFILFVNLGVCLNFRYERNNSIADLEEGISLAQEALNVIPLSHILRLETLCNLGLRLGKRYQHTSDIADIMEAILLLRQAVDESLESDQELPQRLLNLALKLHLKYGHTKNIADLEEAIQIGQRAADTVSPTNINRPRFLIPPGLYLRQRSNLMMGCARAARRAHDDQSETYYHSKAMEDIEKAQNYFIDAVYHEKASFRTRVLAGQHLFDLRSFPHHVKAYDITKLVMSLVPMLSPRAIQNSDKQHVLSELSGISSSAAAIFLKILPADRRVFAAIECLETGRGLIGGALFEQYDSSALEKHYPDLAQTYRLLKDQLDKQAPRDSYVALYETAENIQAAEAVYGRIEKDYAQIIETIRSKPNFQRFLLPNSELDMLDTTTVACGGPIVFLNMSDHRCDALIIDKSGIKELNLSNISPKIVDEYSQDMEALETLGWLWEDIVCPVLNALGYTKTPSDTCWPRVWWIPTGKLSRFPLHAAGHHLRRNGETTLDRVVSSYATSVKALIHGRKLGVSKVAEPWNVVAVAMEETDEEAPFVHAPLAHAGQEVDSVLEILESSSINCVRPRPYKSDVLSSVKTCQIFHFAGHGETHPTDPLRSALLLSDWQNEPLTIESLLETNLSSNPPFLAYLSACGTGQILNETSVDESIHLANAFQLAGFRHVIGTLWSVDDELCVEIAKMTYNSFRGELRDDLVSRGLHDAIRVLRDRWVDVAEEEASNESRAVDRLREGRHAQVDDEEELGRPLWIPYVHFGV